MDEYNTGDWGIGIFINPKNEFKGKITAFRQIIDIDRKYVLFKDDHCEHIIERKLFTFEKKKEPTEK